MTATRAADHEDMELSVVICHGSVHDVWPTVRSVTAEWDPMRHEIIVARAASLAAEALPDGVRTVVVPSTRATVIRNRGAWHARGRYLLFLDNDVTLAPGWRAPIEALIASACPAAHGTWVVEGSWRITEANESGLWLARELWEQEPFDEQLGPGTPFSSSEASDVQARVERRLGTPMVHASYVVLHPAIPMPMPPIKTLCYSLGNGYVYAKHGRTRHAVWAVVKALVRAVVSTGASRRASGIRAAALLGGYLAYRRPCDDVVGEHQ